MFNALLATVMRLLSKPNYKPEPVQLKFVCRFKSRGFDLYMFDLFQMQSQTSNLKKCLNGTSWRVLNQAHMVTSQQTE